MMSNVHIDYVPNEKLYLVIRDDEGRVRLNQKIGVFVPWKDEDIAKYQFPFTYMGGDRYVCEIPIVPTFIQTPKGTKVKAGMVQVFLKYRKIPDNTVDELLVSTGIINETTLLRVKEYPNKAESRVGYIGSAMT